MTINFDEDSLVVEQNKYTIKIVNVTHTLYELDIPKNPQFCLQNFLFDATYIAKKTNKTKWLYSGYGNAFAVKAAECSFGNGFYR